MIVCKYEKTIEGLGKFQFGYNFRYEKERVAMAICLMLLENGEQYGVHQVAGYICVTDEELERKLYQLLRQAQRDCKLPLLELTKEAIPLIKNKIKEGYFKLRANETAIKELYKYGV